MANNVNPIQFELSFNNGAEKLRLPVNPPSIQISSAGDFQDVQVFGFGEYTLIGDPKLSDYSFASFFPAEYNPSYCEYEGFPTPEECRALLEKWQASRRPIRLKVSGLDINTAVTIRGFEIEPEKDGAVGDIYYTLSLKEYVFLDFKRIKDEKGQKVSAFSNTASRPDESVKPKTYRVKSGDSLWKIAQRIYGDGSKYTVIYEANKAVIGKNKSLIKPGTELKLP